MKRVFCKKEFTLSNFSCLCIAVTAQLLLTFGVNGLDIKADGLPSFRRAGWEGSENSEGFDLPSKFKRFDKTDLDNDVSGAGVWTENVLLDDNPKAVIYAFHGLVGRKLCDVTQATINVKYFSHHAAASVSPCKNGHGGSEYCYLSAPGQTKIEWMTQNMEIKRFEEIKLDIWVIPGGYFIFDDITISHNGREAIDDSCDTTTTTEITSETTTTEESTTLGSTETSDTEGPGNTWDPIPTTEVPETTTTTESPTTTTVDPTATTEIPVPEIPEITTTTDPSTETSSIDPSTETSSIDPSTETSSIDPSTETSSIDPSTETSSIDPSSTFEASSLAPSTDFPTSEITFSTEQSAKSSNPTTESPLDTTVINIETSELPSSTTEETEAYPTGFTNTRPTTTPQPVIPGSRGNNGLTTEEAVLYVVVPGVVGLLMLLFLGTVFYFGVRKYRHLSSKKKDYSRFSVDDEHNRSEGSEVGINDTHQRPSLDIQTRELPGSNNWSAYPAYPITGSHPQTNHPSSVNANTGQMTPSFSNQNYTPTPSVMGQDGLSIYSNPNTRLIQGGSANNVRPTFTGEYTNESISRPVQLPRMRRK